MQRPTLTDTENTNWHITAPSKITGKRRWRRFNWTKDRYEYADDELYAHIALKERFDAPRSE